MADTKVGKQKYETSGKNRHQHDHDLNVGAFSLLSHLSSDVSKESKLSCSTKATV